jgi:hypothetical protein
MSRIVLIQPGIRHFYRLTHGNQMFYSARTGPQLEINDTIMLSIPGALNL